MDFAHCFIYDFVFQGISERTLCSKDFPSYLRDILNENNYNFNSYKLSYKLALIPFLPFSLNQNQEPIF